MDQPQQRKIKLCKYAKDSRRAKRFRYDECGGVERLIDKNGKIFMKNEEIFDVLWEAHREVIVEYVCE